MDLMYKYIYMYIKSLLLCIFQDHASPKFTILVQLVPCANQEFDTCLKSLKILLNNDKNNVS